MGPRVSHKHLGGEGSSTPPIGGASGVGGGGGQPAINGGSSPFRLMSTYRHLQ